MIASYLLKIILRHRVFLSGFGSAIGIVAIAWTFWPISNSPGKMSSATLDVPIVMHTQGGQLEVATVSVTEAFRLDGSQKTFFGIDLGQSVSHIQAKVVYRYHIKMEKEWPIRFQGHTAVVQASEIIPTLPVAFDSSTIRRETAAGWARFDKNKNLIELEGRMSPELEMRSKGYKPMALTEARKTVSEFTRTWLAGQKNWQTLKISEIKVVFPGDPPVGNTTLRPDPDQ